MYVISVHHIHDPDKFWETAKGPNPEGFTLHFSIASDDGKRAVCLWQAGSADAVQQLLDGALGTMADNETFEAEEDYAAQLGLPSGLPPLI